MAYIYMVCLHTVYALVFFMSSTSLVLRTLLYITSITISKIITSLVYSYSRSENIIGEEEGQIWQFLGCTRPFDITI